MPINTDYDGNFCAEFWTTRVEAGNPVHHEAGNSLAELSDNAERLVRGGHFALAILFARTDQQDGWREVNRFTRDDLLQSN